VEGEQEELGRSYRTLLRLREEQLAALGDGGQLTADG
jgi:hypothetical protein